MKSTHRFYLLLLLLGEELTFSSFLRLIRAKQWIKNSFVLAPLFFSARFTDLASIFDAFLAAFLFCLASSAAYIVNDYHDIRHDKKHPQKAKQRPLASGQVSKPQALILLSILYGVLLGSIFGGREKVLAVIFAYLLLNLAYTFFLKSQPVIDIFTIATGFVLRVYAGAVALSITLSSWMFVTTFCLALYLAAVKRRQEILSEAHNDAREVLQSYSLALVDRYANISATGTLLFYSMFVITARPELSVTIPFVIYGLFRYWFIVELLNKGESPTDALLSDWQLLTVSLFWTTTSGWILWAGGG